MTAASVRDKAAASKSNAANDNCLLRMSRSPTRLAPDIRSLRNGPLGTNIGAGGGAKAGNIKQCSHPQMPLASPHAPSAMQIWLAGPVALVRQKTG